LTAIIPLKKQAKVMISTQSLRKCISNNRDELIIYGADNFSQFPQRNATVASKSDRTLPVACSGDLVILRGKLDKAYHNWLQSLGLGSDYVVEYKAQSSDMSLSELIINDPAPIKEIIQKTGKKPIYVPWYSGQNETEVAKVLGSDLFGASYSITLKYNDKASFKAVCRQLGLPVVEGKIFEMNRDISKNFLEMKQIVNDYLSSYKTVIIRGTLGEFGMSLYKTDGSDISDVYHDILNSGEKSVIIEPFLSVISSPNDQWAISSNGNINHLGIVDQILENGMVHVASLKGGGMSPNILNTITEASFKIVSDMAESGYTGVVGIDYIDSEDGLFPVENNARFNGSSYARMIVDNIEALTSPIPCWKFIKIKTPACSFLELTERIKPILYDGKKTYSVFPYNCDKLSQTGNFSVILLAKNSDQISNLEKLLKQMDVKRN